MDPADEDLFAGVKLFDSTSSPSSAQSLRLSVLLGASICLPELYLAKALNLSSLFNRELSQVRLVTINHCQWETFISRKPTGFEMARKG